MIGEERITPRGGESCPIGDGKGFQSRAKRLRKKSGGGDSPIFQVSPKRKRRSGSGKIFDARKKNGGEGGEMGGSEDEEGCATCEPVLIVMDGGQGEDEIAEPVGQTNEVRSGGGGGAGNHKVTSGMGFAGGQPLLSGEFPGRRADFGSGRNRNHLRK